MISLPPVPCRRFTHHIFAPVLAGLLLTWLPAGPGRAGSGVWTGGGPGGASGWHAVWDPADPDRVYLAPIAGGVYRSADGGLSWEPANAGLPSGVTIDELVVAGDGTLYVAEKEGGRVRFFVSTDAGESWIERSDDLATQEGVTGLAVDPSDAETIYLSGMPSLVVKSTDGGVSWAPAEDGLDTDVVTEVAVDPGDPSVIWAGGANPNPIHRSVDGGLSWAPVGEGFGQPRQLVVDPADSSTLFGLTSAGIFRTTDQAATWTQVEFGVAFVLGIDVAGTLWAGVDELLERSDDGGDTWSEVPSELPMGAVNGIALRPDGLARLAAAGTGAFRFEGDAPGRRQTTGLDRFPALDVATASAAPDRLWASSAAPAWFGSYLRGVSRSDDGGTAWSELESTTAFTEIAVAPGSQDRLWATTKAQVLESIDGGATWVEKNDDPGQFGFLPGVQSIAPHPSEPETLFVANDSPAPFLGVQPAVLRSLDGGIDWEPLWEPSPDDWTLVAAWDVAVGADGRQLYVSSLSIQGLVGGVADAFVHSSPDAGVSWVHSLVGEDHFFPHSLTVDATRPEVAWVTLGASGTETDRLVATTDGGATWTDVATASACLGSVAADPAVSGTLYLGGCDGVWVSFDDGASWEPLGTGLPEDVVGVESLAVSTTSPRVVHAGTWRGVWSLTTPVRLAVEDACPEAGAATLTITNATPDADVALLRGAAPGLTALPAGPCAGKEVGIDQPQLLRIVTAGPAGELSIAHDLTAGACGSLLQAVDLTTCTVSPVRSPGG